MCVLYIGPAAMLFSFEKNLDAVFCPDIDFIPVVQAIDYLKENSFVDFAEETQRRVWDY